jgi:hypothetical protein
MPLNEKYKDINTRIAQTAEETNGRTTILWNACTHNSYQVKFPTQNPETQCGKNSKEHFQDWKPSKISNGLTKTPQKAIP